MTAGTARIAAAQGSPVNLRYIDWIWHIRGRLALAPGQSGDEAFARLDPLFHEPGTTHERTGDTLIFHKKDQAAQDKMAVFDSGILKLEHDEAGPALRYDLTSRALLFCFLAPLLFLAIAQATIGIGTLEKQSTAAAGKAGAAAVAAKKAAEKKAAEKIAAMPMNPIDKFLGAPAPEKPEKDDKKAGGDDDEDQGPKPTPAYIFAGIFAALYIGGRILEAWLIKSLFRKRLLGS